MNTEQNQAALLKMIPNLMGLVTKAQAHLATIASHLVVAQDGAIRSSLPTVDGEPRFTQNFEDASGEFLCAVEEISNVFNTVAESIEFIKGSTEQLVVGVNRLQGEEVDDEPSPDTLPRVEHAIQ
jgi:hypothetical protein